VSGRLKTLPIGSKLPTFPGGTFNAAILEILREQGHARPGRAAHDFTERSCALVQLFWNGGGTLRDSSVVKLGAPLFDPGFRASAPYEGLRFVAGPPDPLDEEEGHFAITLGPIEQASCGYGYIPGATWARVNISDESHNFATTLASDNTLASAYGGRFPMLWRPDADGEQFCIVALLAAGVSILQSFEATSGISAMSSWGNYGTGTVQFKTDAGEDDGPGDVIVENRSFDIFENQTVGFADRSYDPPRLIVPFCTPAP
jgi:hypothetical protein